MSSVFFMYALFASVFSVGKIALIYCPPYFLTAIRMALAGALLVAIQWLWKPSDLRVSRKDWPLLLLIGLFNVFLTNALEFWGLERMESAKTCLIYSLSPFVAVAAAFLFLGERMSWKKWIGFGVGMASMIPMCAVGEEGAAREFPPTLTLPELALIVSASTAVLGWIFMKKLTKEKGYPILMANAFSFLIGALFSFTTSFALESWDHLPNLETPPAFWIAFFYIVIIHNIICYTIYAYSLERFSVTFMTFAGLSNPLFAALFGWFFLDEQIGFAFFLSLGLVSVGLCLFAWAERSEQQVALQQPV